MRLTRRDFLAATSAAALLAGSAGRAGASNDPFDIEAAFTAFMTEIGATAEDGGGDVTFTGREPILRSHFRIGASMALPAMAAAVGAAAIWRERTGEGQDARIDLREAIYNVNPLLTPIMRHRIAVGALPADDPVASAFTFTPTINGRLYQAPVGIGNPFSFVPFRARDGRFVNITGAYPHLNARALTLLECAPTREAIAAAVAGWDGEALEAAMFETKAVGVMHRTAEEWLVHPEGAYLAATPLITITKVGEADAPSWTPNPTQPLSGIKAIALTHVIAGSTAARTLSEYGAEILHVARDQSFEHEALWTDVNIGMRSTTLDLATANDAEALNRLIPEADVVIEGFSGRGIERLGFGVEEVAARRPGIVYLTVRGYSWDGPWRDIRTFDMEAVSVTGFTMAEGSGGRPSLGESFGQPDVTPVFPPTLVLNDYIAGYLGAAGILAALRRRAADGGSWHVHVNLARAAMWYASLGTFPSTDFVPEDDQRIIEPETIRFDSPYGEVHRLAPLVKLSRTPGRWQEPLLTVRGSDRPEWRAE